MLPASEWVEDLRSAVSFLRTRSEIDPEHIGAVGISMGGSTVVEAAALDERIRCVVSLCPVGDGRRWYEWLWTQNLGPGAWQNFLRLYRARPSAACFEWSLNICIDTHSTAGAR